MKYFHGIKKEPYFEGWYFKHQSTEHSFACIPAVVTTQEGITKGVLQILTKNKSWCFEYLMDKINIEAEQLSIRMGSCFFSDRGIVLDINDKGVNISAKIAYETFYTLEKDIMGPFKYLPKMECKHGVISMFHKIYGEVKINEEEIIFNEDIGYIEMDYGYSFPEHYVWTHGAFEDEFQNSIMVAGAKIPFLKMSFMGCIACVLYHGQQIIFATYLGGKVEKLSDDEIIISQNSLKLHAWCKSRYPVELKAPKSGDLNIKIYENLVCEVHYQMFKDGVCIIDKVVENASFE